MESTRFVSVPHDRRPGMANPSAEEQEAFGMNYHVSEGTRLPETLDLSPLRRALPKETVLALLRSAPPQLFDASRLTDQLLRRVQDLGEVRSELTSSVHADTLAALLVLPNATYESWKSLADERGPSFAVSVLPLFSVPDLMPKGLRSAVLLGDYFPTGVLADVASRLFYGPDPVGRLAEYADPVRLASMAESFGPSWLDELRSDGAVIGRLPLFWDWTDDERRRVRDAGLSARQRALVPLRTGAFRGSNAEAVLAFVKTVLTDELLSELDERDARDLLCLRAAFLVAFSANPQKARGLLRDSRSRKAFLQAHNEWRYASGSPNLAELSSRERLPIRFAEDMSARERAMLEDLMAAPGLEPWLRATTRTIAFAHAPDRRQYGGIYRPAAGETEVLVSAEYPFATVGMVLHEGMHAVEDAIRTADPKAAQAWLDRYASTVLFDPGSISSVIAAWKRVEGPVSLQVFSESFAEEGRAYLTDDPDLSPPNAPSSTSCFVPGSPRSTCQPCEGGCTASLASTLASPGARCGNGLPFGTTPRPRSRFAATSAASKTTRRPMFPIDTLGGFWQGLSS